MASNMHTGCVLEIHDGFVLDFPLPRPVIPTHLRTQKTSTTKSRPLCIPEMSSRLQTTLLREAGAVLCLVVWLNSFGQCPNRKPTRSETNQNPCMLLAVDLGDGSSRGVWWRGFYMLDYWVILPCSWPACFALNLALFRTHWRPSGTQQTWNRRSGLRLICSLPAPHVRGFQPHEVARLPTRRP